MLLILTSDQDLAADYLIVELIERQLPYFRLNSEEISKAKFVFSLDKASKGRSISVGPRTLDLSSVQAVWYRRAIHPTVDAPMTSAERFFVAGELRHLTFGLLWNPHVTWVNRIDRVYVAEHKLHQLQLAASLGFRVPRTLVSADIDELRSFAAKNSAGTICKPIFHGMFFDGASQHSVYTRRLDVESLTSANLRSCPLLVQEEIPRISDVRATFIGPQCFVADIRGKTPSVDWRDPNTVIDYDVASLDEVTTARCRQMLSRLGLLYGAFDFIRTPTGDLVFLELNPTGEWAWLEDMLGFPMRSAFVEVFYGSKR